MKSVHINPTFTCKDYLNNYYYLLIIIIIMTAGQWQPSPGCWAGCLSTVLLKHMLRIHPQTMENTRRKLCKYIEAKI